MKCWSCSWILSCNKNTTESKVSQENYEFRPLRNVCTETLTYDLRLPVVLQTISRVQWNIHQINNCLFKQLVIRSTFQCVHAPQSLVFDLFLAYKEIQFFSKQLWQVMPKIPSVLCWTVLSGCCHVALFGDIGYGRDHVTQMMHSRTHLLPLLLFSPSQAAFFYALPQRYQGQHKERGRLEVSSSVTLGFLQSSTNSALIKSNTKIDVRTCQRGWGEEEQMPLSVKTVSFLFDMEDYFILSVCFCVFMLWQRSVYATKDKKMVRYVQDYLPL